MEMGLVAGRDLQDGGLDLDEVARREEGPQRRRDAGAPQKERAAVGMDMGRPPGRGRRHSGLSRPARGLAKNTGKTAHNQYVPATNKARRSLAQPWRRAPGRFSIKEDPVKVIASSLRKGNIVDIDGKLYVVLNAESFHPGKGTPTTQVDMRRISDGVKTAQRYKTTEQVERAHVEDHEFQFLYQDGDGLHFMNMENYDQVTLPADLVGDQAVYLEPEMKVMLAIHEGVPVSINLPQKTTLEVVETQPATKGQTAASSYKPAVLSNGVRTNVPPHIATGTRIVVMTADGSYVERAKD
jgi:elongation factor P